jgi:KDO2-lipid IV(A) lauroyltransferase
MKNKIEFFLLLFFFYISRFIGVKLSSNLGGSLAWVYGLFSKRNLIGMKNLNLVFPEKNLIEKKKILRRMWFHFGRVIGEYPHLHKINIHQNTNIKIVGIKNLLGPLKKEKNCIYFSAHIGNWELSSHPLTQNGFKINFIYRAFNNKYVDNLLRKIRFKYGVNLIKKGSDGAKECIKALKNKENLGMLIDQKMNDGLPIIFFNKLAMTAPAIAKFSLKFKCQIVPALCVREKGIKYKIEYFKPIKYSFLKKLGSEEKIMLYLNKIIEGWILKYPEQWTWVHDRWIKD